MNKILAGIIGLIIVSGVAFSSAEALFTTTASASDVTFSTGSSSLLIWDGDSYEQDWLTSNLDFTGMYPGYGGDGSFGSPNVHYQTFWLKNESTSNILLAITGKLRDGVTESPPGAWNVLKDKVMVNVALADLSASTGWKTLAEWNAGGVALPGGTLAQGIEREYRFYVLVDATANNDIAGQMISDIHYDFTGTQSE